MHDLSGNEAAQKPVSSPFILERGRGKAEKTSQDLVSRRSSTARELL